MTRPRRSRRTCSLLCTLIVVSLTAGACGDSRSSTGATSTTAPPADPGSTTTISTESDGATAADTGTETSAETEAGAGDEPVTTTTEAPGPGPRGTCVVEPVPTVAGLDPFYTQGCNLRGFWVVASDVVDPGAVAAAGDLADAFFVADPVLARAVVDSGVRLGIIGADQRTTEMPEYRDLPEAFPDVDWDSRARGLGSTPERPLVSAGEENVLCLPGDRYQGEDILLHEFAHTLHLQGLAVVVPDFDAELTAAFDQALVDGTWSNTYSVTNVEEYWAEGVQSYFDRNEESDPANGIHGPINTRIELEAGDALLFGLIDRQFGAVELPPRCGVGS